MTNESCFNLESDSTSVHFWTDKRLPFEPKGQMLEARNALRSALRRLVSDKGKILSATYSSLEQSFCDAENILFYNVGAAAFGTVATKGIRFDRLHCVPCVSHSGRHFKHHHHYRIADMPHPAVKPPDASFKFVLGSLSSSTKPHEVWWPASDSGPGPISPIKGSFEMRVALQIPSPFLNLTSVIKPLLDGVICAFHFDSNPDPIAVQRLAATTGLEREMILHRLQSPKTPILGSRRLLDPYRSFVKWNPADDLCQTCTVVCEQSPARHCCVDVWDRQETK